MEALNNPYLIFKWVHILLATIAIGFNASYGIWIALAARYPEHLLYTLRGIKRLDDRFANPAYVLLLLTGFGMVGIGRIPITTFWIAAALVLWVVAIAAGYGLYTPTLRRQIQVLEASGADSPEYRALQEQIREITEY